MNSVIVSVAKYFVFLSIRIVAALWLRTKMDVKINLGWQLVVGGALAVLLSTISGHH